MSSRTVTPANMNQNIKKMKYASRTALTIRVKEIEMELRKGAPKPFSEIIKADIGDCHAMGQKPLTFVRQVLALCAYPELMKDSHFPDDVKYRAEAILNSCAGNSVGSYSESTGLDVIKKHVAEYIERRDGATSDPQNIMLTAGASEAIKSVLCLLNYSESWKPIGVMLPVPRYLVHSAILAEYDMHEIGYYLDEDHDWTLNIKELNRALKEARNVCQPRAIIIINPGNPTGSVLSRKSIEEIIRFAYKEKLFLMADEVYQDNVYAEDTKFYSFKKIMIEMGAPYKDMELTSFMSASKGYMGECGLRAGYCEIINTEPDVRRMLFKATAARLCSNVLGQATMDCIVNPPWKGEPSYDLFMKEKERVLRSLKERAALVTKMINNIPGMKCNRIAGAMYAFPRLFLPQKAIQKAQSLDQSPDFFYAMHLLENTGIHVLPGSGFGQISGTYHLRITILPQMGKLKDMLQRLEQYHLTFLQEYR